MGIRARSNNLVEKERKGERDEKVLANPARITNMCFGGLPRAGSRDWPANFEPGMGMLLPDETYEERSSFNSISNNTTEDLFDDIDEFEAAKALAVLQKCDDFLKRHGIRPEFFCRHRERLALQSWLLQKSKLSSGKLDLFYLYCFCFSILFISYFLFFFDNDINQLTISNRSNYFFLYELSRTI